MGDEVEAADITGMTQPKVSQVRRYKLQNISLERLMQALVSLDQHVEIVVRPAHRTHAPGITVAGTPSGSPASHAAKPLGATQKTARYRVSRRTSRSG
jgi:hypothetical protein